MGPYKPLLLGLMSLSQNTFRRLPKPPAPSRTFQEWMHVIYECTKHHHVIIVSIMLSCCDYLQCFPHFSQPFWFPYCSSPSRPVVLWTACCSRVVPKCFAKLRKQVVAAWRRRLFGAWRRVADRINHANFHPRNNHHWEVHVTLIFHVQV